MKKVKCIAAILLSVILALSTSIVAFAATNYTITVKNTTAEQVYSAYKVFDATYNDDGGVSYKIYTDNPWYSIVKGYTLVTVDDEGNVTNESIASPFTLDAFKDANGTTYYQVTQSENASEDDVITFFETFFENLNNSAVTVKDSDENTVSEQTITAAATATANGGDLVLDVSESGAGYYFVTSTLGATVTLTTTTPAATVIDKNDEPTVDKWIIDSDGNKIAWDTEAMGDEVQFEVEAYVPLYSGDEIVTEYEFTDTMDIGLEIELEADQIVSNTRTVGGVEETYYTLSKSTAETWFTLTNVDGKYWAAEAASEGDENYQGTIYAAVSNLVVELNDVTEIKDSDGNITGIIAQGYTITYYTYDKVAYDAAKTAALADEELKELSENELNEYLVQYFDTSAYPLQGTLTIDYFGHIDEDEEDIEENDVEMQWMVTSYNLPTPDVIKVGGTLDDSTDNYETEVQLVKRDAKDDTNLLQGATFTLTGEKLNKIKVSYTAYIAVDDDNPLPDGATIYYLLTDGTYTDEAPTEDTASNYEHSGSEEEPIYTQYYFTTITETQTSTEDVNIIGTTGEDGKVNFKGLNEGTYEITEITAPDGYNRLSSSITLEVKFNETTNEDGTTSYSWTFTVDGEDTTIDADGVYVLYVDNNSGSILPITGGIGTTIFYISGAVLVIAAAVALIIIAKRRKMTAKQN